MKSSTSSGLIGMMPGMRTPSPLAVKGLQGEAAGIDLAALRHELGEPLVEAVAGEGLVAERRKAALQAERDARSVEQDGGLVAFAQQPRGLQHVDQADGAFERHGVKGDERLLAGIGLDVFKDLLFVVDEEVAFLLAAVVTLGMAILVS